MYIHFNPNPTFSDPNDTSWSRGDCVIRAVACACGWSWQNAYEWCCMSSMGVCDLPNSVEGFRKIMKDLHFSKTILDAKYKMTVKDFMESHKTGTYILSVEGLTGHVVCGKDGDWYDAFNSGKFLVFGYHKKQINPYIPREPLPLRLRFILKVRHFLKKIKKPMERL